MKLICVVFMIILSGSVFCQSSDKLNLATLQKQLVEFLIANGDINVPEHIQDYKEGKRIVFVSGLHNNFKKDPLINGIYSFSQSCSHCKAYFLIVDDGNVTILNISNRKGLNEAIINTLDFCEKYKYCGSITEDYISRLIGVYNNKNKQLAGFDLNCQRGVKDTKKLP